MEVALIGRDGVDPGKGHKGFWFPGQLSLYFTPPPFLVVLHGVSQRKWGPGLHDFPPSPRGEDGEIGVQLPLPFVMSIGLVPPLSLSQAKGLGLVL